ncbi:hypothetical protein Tco_0371157 [Tanacetum coccineum]
MMVSTLWIKLYSEYEYEIHYHLGKANVVTGALSRKERVKPRRVRRDGYVHSVWRLRWMIYLVVLADAAESVRDTIGFEYCLASSSGWTKSPVLWAEIGESSLTGPELVLDMTDKVVLIKEKLKAARDRQKSYADNRRKPLEFEVGDRVMLKVSPWKGVIRFGKKGKLAPRYVGPFEILERVGPVAYRLRLPEELSGIKVDKTLRFVEEPVENSDREVKRLKCSRMVVVKVHLGSKRGEWLKFNNRDFSLDNRKEFKTRLVEIQKKEIERPGALDIEEFAARHEGIALQNLNQFCHVSFTQDDRTFTSQAWNMDNIVDLDNVDTMVFQLGREKRSMTMRQFILALGLYTPEEMGNNLFEPFYESCFRSRHSGKEKVTLDDLFLLHSMDGGVSRETSLLNVAKLVDLGICKYNALGHGEMVDDVSEVVEDEGAGAGAGMGQAIVGCYPKI